MFYISALSVLLTQSRYINSQLLTYLHTHTHTHLHTHTHTHTHTHIQTHRITYYYYYYCMIYVYLPQEDLRCRSRCWSRWTRWRRFGWRRRRWTVRRRRSVQVRCTRTAQVNFSFVRILNRGVRPTHAETRNSTVATLKPLVYASGTIDKRRDTWYF